MRRPLTTYEKPGPALGMCAIASTEFSKRRRGWGLVRVTGLTYPGREHWASLFATEDLEGAIVRDGTMRQFDPGKPAPWKGSLDDWLDDMTELLVDGLEYECFMDSVTREPFFTDTWVRDDIEPGPMPVRSWYPYDPNQVYGSRQPEGTLYERLIKARNLEGGVGNE